MSVADEEPTVATSDSRSSSPSPAAAIATDEEPGTSLRLLRSEFWRVHRLADKHIGGVVCEEPVRTSGNSGTILFYSEASDPSWPTELQKAFPTFTVRTRPEDTDPTDVVAAIVWKYPAGMLRQFANLR